LKEEEEDVGVPTGVQLKEKIENLQKTCMTSVPASTRKGVGGQTCTSYAVFNRFLKIPQPPFRCRQAAGGWGRY